MNYTGAGQIVCPFNPSGLRERVRVPTFGGDIVHVVRKLDGKGRLVSETVDLTSVAKEQGWAWDESPAPKIKSKK